ncbi:MAG: hypothetical protein HXM69_06360 [Mogibacterium diversum]|nr:hypothetical protein [Mogibacterium diversum]
MTYNDVYNYFINFKDIDPPITSKLVSNGYRQIKGSYIKKAKERNIDNPTQWWRIISLCEEKIKNDEGNKYYSYTPCGELLVYMAERTNDVDKRSLENLINDIINSNKIDNRREWNKVITELCWYQKKQ